MLALPEHLVVQPGVPQFLLKISGHETHSNKMWKSHKNGIYGVNLDEDQPSNSIFGSPNPTGRFETNTEPSCLMVLPAFSILHLKFSISGPCILENMVFFTWWLCTWPGRPAGWRSPPPCLGNRGNELLLFLFIFKQSLFSSTFTATRSSTSLQAFLLILLQLLACARLDEVAASHHADQRGLHSAHACDKKHICQ